MDSRGSLGLTRRITAFAQVALRVPCLFLIDAVLHSPQGFPRGNSLWVSLLGALLRLLGVFVCSVILVLSQQTLFKFYMISSAFLLATTSVFVNYYAFLHIDFQNAFFTASHKGSSLWMTVPVLQLAFAVGYIALLNIQSVHSLLIILDLLIPTVGFIIELSFSTREILILISGLFLTLYTMAILLSRFYYSVRYVRNFIRFMYHFYGLQALVDDMIHRWRKIRFPDVLRVFWLTRLTAQAVVLIYVIKMAETDPDVKFYMISWDSFWELLSSLINSGCDSTLTILGMSAVISSISHRVGLGILGFIGSTDERERLGNVVSVSFFILALLTGLSWQKPEERLVRLYRNMFVLLATVLDFIHEMTDRALMSLSASNVTSFRRHFPVLLVLASLFVLPILVSYILWQYYARNAWLFAFTVFSVELCVKVIVSVTIYALFMVDGYYNNVLWEKLDDYVSDVRSTSNIIEFIFGLINFGIGAYAIIFEATGLKILGCMMCLDGVLQSWGNWKIFINYRTSLNKINLLPEITGEQLNEIDDVCSICYQEFTRSACVTPCHHYFHALCLRKWLYIKDTCPMCHQKVHKEKENSASNNGALEENEPNEHPVQELAANDGNE